MGDLKITSENLRFFVRVAVEQYRSGSVTDVGKALTTIAVYHRALGIARYLQYHDRVGFAACVGRSVQARLGYLRQVQAEKSSTAPRYSTTAHNRALYDAIVVGDDASATELATRGRGRWNSDYEYEDDFLVNEFLHEYYLAGAAGDPAAAQLQPLLDRLATVTGDPAAPELLVGKALLTGDADAFEAGLGGMIAARAKRFAEETMMPPELAATEQHVFMQGLAMTRLARRRGIRTADEYPTIPEPLLTLEPSHALGDDAWQQLD
jgi:hypothetical protein